MTTVSPINSLIQQSSLDISSPSQKVVQLLIQIQFSIVKTSSFFRNTSHSGKSYFFLNDFFEARYNKHVRYLFSFNVYSSIFRKILLMQVLRLSHVKVNRICQKETHKFSSQVLRVLTVDILFMIWVTQVLFLHQNAHL